MVIDFHTHAFPDKIAAGALSSLTENTRRFADVYGESRPHHDGTLAGLAASSRMGGVDISLILPIATSPKPSHSINDFAALADKQPGLRSFGSVHPRSPAWREELERLKMLGLLGIKLHPEYQGCYVDEPETVEVVKAAGELGLVVVFHAGVDVGMKPPFHCTPERAVRLREAAPGTRIVLAHLGGDWMWDEALRELSRMDFYFDTSRAIPEHPDRWDLFGDFIRTVGPDRVIFGTDSPWTEQKTAVEQTREFLRCQRFTPAETAAILGGNAAALLQIPSDPPAGPDGGLSSFV